MKGEQTAMRWLDRFYRVPNPFRTIEEYERYYHQDLPRFSKPQLVRERERVRHRLVFDDDPPEWLLLRLYRLEEILP